MGIEMPAEVKWLIPIVVGDSWPEGDETALQRLGEVWKQAATDVDEAMRQAEDAVKQATSHMDGEAAEAFKRYRTTPRVRRPWVSCRRRRSR